VVAALIVLVGLGLGKVIDPLQGGALTMLPALALTALMLLRPYLGERTLARLRARRVRPPEATHLAAVPQRPPVRVVRGGRLIAVALAGRAPPLACAGCG
jgi:hypothetical protein